MGSADPFPENVPIETKIKSLPDEVLLEMWVESQLLEYMVAMQMPKGYALQSGFEAVIIHELWLRSSRKTPTL